MSVIFQKRLPLYFLCCVASVTAADIRFSHLSSEDGLSQSSVYAMVQDRFGFMWFGTADGLNRYDGYTFRVFKYDREEEASLSDSWVTALFEDGKGRLWVGSFGSGLNRLNEDRESFTRFDLGIRNQGLGSNRVKRIIECSDGYLWIAVENSGLVIIDGDTGEIQKTYTHNPEDPDSLSSDLVYDLFLDRDQTLWVATEMGLDSYQNGGFVHYKHDPSDARTLSSNRIMSIAQDEAGGLWVGSANAGVNYLDPQTGIVERHLAVEGNPETLTDNQVNAIYKDSVGAVWVATAQGLNRFDKGVWSQFLHSPSEPFSIAHPNLLSLYEDQGGVLWVGTYGGGISKFNRLQQGFRYYRRNPRDPKGFKSEYVFGMHEDRDGLIWIGSPFNGLSIFDPRTQTFRHFVNNPEDPNSLSDNRVYSIVQDGAGRIWVATYKGLNRYIPEQDRFERFLMDGESGFEEGATLLYAYVDRTQQLWLGSSNAGLLLMDSETGTVTRFDHEPGNPRSLTNNVVNAIFEDTSGNLWVGTDLGLNLKQEDGFQQFLADRENPASLSHNSVMCFYQRRDGELWIGTYGGGISRLNLKTMKFSTIGEREGLPNDSVYGMVDDKRGFVWVSTNNGIARMEPDSGEIKIFDTSNLLYYNEFNRNGSLRRQNGEVLFGGRGFYKFFPTDIKDNPYVPPIVLTSFRKFNREAPVSTALPELTSIDLKHDDSVVSFSFAAMDFTSPGKNRFRYKLSGFNDDWIELNTENSLTYTNLNPGDYQLMIMGSNNDGLWNPEPLTIGINVSPPFWASLWAYAVYVLIVIGAIYAFARYRARQKRRALHRAIAVGKARFAATVLHNIGNVLSSLKVSSDTSRRHLKESKIRQLVKAHGLMSDNMDDIGDYLTQDPKGKLLPGYFISAGEVLLEEHEELVEEMGEISRKIGLMTDIIESQQAYAKQELIEETHDLNQVTQEALRVVEDTLRRHGVQVSTKFDELPPVKAHKSQLMHIIINLAKNAAEAMVTNPSQERLLTVETGRLSVERAFLKMTDRGEGIPRENLERIFSYGFTTKEDGHGFGLHSCAKSMREMGGAIHAQSEGPGHGATFSLDLSFANPME